MDKTPRHGRRHPKLHSGKRLRTQSKRSLSGNLFDRKFGQEFIGSVPSAPGVYRFYAEGEAPIYVGKARNLRRRLAGYRRARSGKMRKIVQSAIRLEFELHESELDACLNELRLIQEARPKLNIAGAFSHRYPFIGIRLEKAELTLAFTTTPDVLPGYSFFGAFRSRFITSEAFFGLVRLLQYVGHLSPLNAAKRKQYSYEFQFRRLPQALLDTLPPFFKGESPLFLETLFSRMLENAGARAKAEKVQEGIDALETFWNQECVPLAKAIAMVKWKTYPIAQTERDPLFVRAGFEKTSEETP